MTLAFAEESTIVQKICPLPSELSCITKNIPCPEEGCNGTFLNSSNLEMHLSKHHKKRSDGNNRRDNLSKMNCQYHCPVEKCLYNIHSDRYFSHIKYLKQHYLKVHAEKKFLCKKCDKGFSTEAACNFHMRICGMKFTCSCGCNYSSYEALITHAKRKNHSFDANLKHCAKSATHKIQTNSSNESCGITPPGGNSLTLISDNQKSPYIILNSPGTGLTGIPINVKPLGTILPAISPSPSSGIDIGVQTERGLGYNARRTGGGSSGGRRLSAQTQTWSVKRSKICAGTQTQGDYILKRAMRAAQIPVNDSDGVQTKGQISGESGKLPGQGGRKRKKSMETQTTVVSSVDSFAQPIKATSAAETSSRQLRGPFEGGFDGGKSGGENVDQSMNFAPVPPQDSYVTPIIDPWIGVYSKCSSGTQTSPPVKSICHPVVTQTDLGGMLLQDSLSDTHNQNYFYTLPSIKDDSTIASVDSDVNAHSSIPDLSGVTTSIDTSNLAVNDFSETQFDPMFPIQKISPVEGTSSHADGYVNEDVSFRDEAVDLVGTIARACNTETQTEGEAMASDPTLSHIETQTNTEDFLSCSIEQLLHANMCTQTCEDMLFSELGFSNIQTQTQEELSFWQGSDTIENPLSFLVSTETQTAISGGCNAMRPDGNDEAQGLSWISEMSNMETQTDVDELRKLIAELTKHEIEGD